MYLKQGEQSKITALYCRLSKEDFEAGGAHPFLHPKEILSKKP